MDYVNLACFIRGQENPWQAWLGLSSFLKPLWLLLIFPGMVIYLWWFYHAYRNLHLITKEGRYNCKMGVIGWLIPLFNLFIPYQIVDDLFRLTNMKLGKKYSKVFYRLWWFFWIMCHLFVVMILRHLQNLNSIGHLMTADKWLFCYYALVLITVGLKIKTLYDYWIIESMLYQKVVLQGEIWLANR